MKKIAIVLLILGVSFTLFAQTPEEKLTQEHLVLPASSNPVANYVNAVRVGNLVYLSGKGGTDGSGTLFKGKVGSDMNIEQAYLAAQSIALHHMAALKNELGSLSKVKRIVKVLGMVNCTADFTDQPKVINGYSDTMVKIFGEKGKHARSAIGTISLPFNMPVEIEAIVEVE